jgi:post-segregation antitoxin (ccd killing protein)
MMNHNVYLPDEISERARAAELNLSGLLRGAVIDELDRIDTLEAAQDGMSEQTVDVEDRNGESLRLRFTGKYITGRDPDVYLTDEGKVVLVFEEAYETFDDVEDFSDWVANEDRNNLGGSSEEVVREAVAALGGRIVIDL